MSYGSNPYAPAAAINPLPVSKPLAGLDKRFFGALIDGLIGIVFVGPGYVMMGVGGAFSDSNSPNPLIFVGAGLMFLGIIALLVLQIYLLATRSQTIGKYLMKTQIVDVNTGRPADFVHSFLLRLLLNGLISSIPCIGSIYAIVDICFIFREDRRCIHDLLAQTCVVDIS
ncbi:MAG: RDD family protein [Aureliella sp.]